MKFLVFFISLLVFSVECVSQLKCLWGLEQWRHLMSWADQRSLPWGNVGHVASSDHDLSFCLVFLGGMHRHDFFHFPVYDHPYYKYFYISVTVIIIIIVIVVISIILTIVVIIILVIFIFWLLYCYSIFFCWSSDHVYSVLLIIILSRPLWFSWHNFQNLL